MVGEFAARLAERLASIEARILIACTAAARDRSEVTLVAVSKGHPASALAEAYGFMTRLTPMKSTHHEKKYELLISRDLTWFSESPRTTPSKPPRPVSRRQACPEFSFRTPED